MARQEIKVLSSTEYVGRESCKFSKVIELKGKRFKITNDTGNCYSYTKICVLLPNLQWAVVADKHDIGDCHIDYVWSEAKKKIKLADIYERAVKYIKDVFC